MSPGGGCRPQVTDDKTELRRGGLLMMALVLSLLPQQPVGTMVPALRA